MPSISSSTLIRERTRDFCSKINNWNIQKNKHSLFKHIIEHLENEYKIIPEKERIGKGAVYISKYIAREIVQYLKSEIHVSSEYLIELSTTLFKVGEKYENIKALHLALYLFAEFITQFPEKFDDIKHLIENWANYEEWQIRESAGEGILAALKKIPKKTLEYLSELTKSDNENLRRLVSESLRPRADVKWLRNPSKNDKILEILTELRKDPSVYVRKSVGNNLKDLSKYMPEKILDLMEEWIKKSNIKVHDQLATEIELSKDKKQLVWTIKHAMRWLKERNPKYHNRIEKILGKNYILYFNEKRNRLAKPK